MTQFIEEYRLKDIEGKIHSLPCADGVRSFKDLSEADLRGGFGKINGGKTYAGGEERALPLVLSPCESRSFRRI